MLRQVLQVRVGRGLGCHQFQVRMARRAPGCTHSADATTQVHTVCTVCRCCHTSKNKAMRRAEHGRTRKVVITALRGAARRLAGKGGRATVHQRV